MKQKKGGENYEQKEIAEFFLINVFCYEVFVKKKKRKIPRHHYC